MTPAKTGTIARATPRRKQEAPTVGPGTKVAVVRRCGLYLRISNDPTGEGLGVDRQKTACLKRAKDLGWHVTAIYTDNDVGAYGEKPRPRYLAMLEDLKAGVIDAVIVWDLDRLTRRPIEIEHFIALADKHDIALASVDQSVDLTTDNGRLFARIKGAVARSESDRKSARQKASRLQAAESGRPVGGSRVFGYESDHHTVREDEAAEIRWAMDQILTGETTYGIARQWNERGVVTARGGTWQQSTVKQTLVKPRYAGIRTYLGDELAEATWPAIVSEDVFRAVQSILNDPTRKRGPGSRPRWLLSGLALCGYPGCRCTVKIKTVGQRNGVSSPKYMCRQFSHVYRDARHVDRYIEDIILGWLGTADAMALVRNGAEVDVSGLLRQADVQRAKLAELQAEYLEQDSMTLADLRQLKAKVRAKLDKIEKQISAVSQANPVVEIVGKKDAEQRWHDLTLDRKRALVDALLIVTILPVAPGKGPRAGFDPRTVDVKWRHEAQAT